MESLFAKSLKEYRFKAGVHGRLTQEQLAEKLGVSVDAIGKYERSRSFIRGDLEHLLGERLGWSGDTVRACREDWEVRRAGGRAANGYQLLDDALLNELFEGSWAVATDAAIAFASEYFGDLPVELASDSGAFEPMSIAYPECWRAVVLDGRIVAKWVVYPVLPTVEADFRSGGLLECELGLQCIRQTILPGTYFGYCPALVVAPGHERAAGLIMSSFTAVLEDLAQREILFHGIGTISCSPGGAQICRDLGMEPLGPHSLGPGLENWELTGAGIANSIFARKSSVVRSCYSRAFL